MPGEPFSSFLNSMCSDSENSFTTEQRRVSFLNKKNNLGHDDFIEQNTTLIHPRWGSNIPESLKQKNNATSALDIIMKTIKANSSVTKNKTKVRDVSFIDVVSDVSISSHSSKKKKNNYRIPPQKPISYSVADDFFILEKSYEYISQKSTQSHLRKVDFYVHFEKIINRNYSSIAKRAERLQISSPLTKLLLFFFVKSFSESAEQRKIIIIGHGKDVVFFTKQDQPIPDNESSYVQSVKDALKSSIPENIKPFYDFSQTDFPATTTETGEKVVKPIHMMSFVHEYLKHLYESGDVKNIECAETLTSPQKYFQVPLLKERSRNKKKSKNLVSDSGESNKEKNIFPKKYKKKQSSKELKEVKTKSLKSLVDISIYQNMKRTKKNTMDFTYSMSHKGLLIFKKILSVVSIKTGLGEKEVLQKISVDLCETR